MTKERFGHQAEDQASDEAHATKHAPSVAALSSHRPVVLRVEVVALLALDHARWGCTTPQDNHASDSPGNGQPSLTRAYTRSA